MTEETAGAILVAVDGSNMARNAAKVAIKLAQIQGYAIHGLYIVDEALALEAYSDYHREVTFEIDQNDDDGAMAMLEAQGALALNQLEALCEQAGVPVENEMLLGNVEDMILDRAQQAMMIAMGRRGNRHANEPDRLGEHFWQVVHKARIPVIVGGDVAPAQLHKLMFVFTNDEPSLKALHGTTILQRDLNAEVIVVLAGHPDDSQAQAWREQILARIPKEDRAHYQFLRRPEKQVEALVAVAVEHQVDLIVMSQHHHRLAMLDELLGSPLDKVLQQTQLPVIIVH